VPLLASLLRVNLLKEYHLIISFLIFFFWQIKGSTPAACWDKIYRKIRKMQDGTSNGFSTEGGVGRILKSGSEMFGFSNPEVIKLIKVCILVFYGLKIP
jgi:hypothetical protein